MDYYSIKDGIHKLILDQMITHDLGSYALKALKEGDTKGALKIVAYGIQNN
jgi:hypothetical protein